ncbi:MAG TPA: CHAT domain-containing protein [Terracidiphilus sp.]
MLLLVPLQDTRPGQAQAEYNRVRLLFERGDLSQSQHEAELAYKRFQIASPRFAARFELLEAESMLYRGLYDGALSLLAGFHAAGDPEATIQSLSIEGVALARQQQPALADKKIEQAEQFCNLEFYASCADVLKARGILAVNRGDLITARSCFRHLFLLAQVRRDRFQEANAASNLGWISLQDDHFDDAADWSKRAYDLSQSVGAEDLAERSVGNLGWAYFKLGDDERASGLFVQAEKSAAIRGDLRSKLGWLRTIGYIDQQSSDLLDAADSYHRAFDLAGQINSKEDIVNSLEDLAHLSIAMGKLDDASRYLDQLAPLVRATQNRLDDLDVLLARGEIAAARNQEQAAEADFRTVEADPESQISMRLGAEHELAKLYERRGDRTTADRMYTAALTTFEQAREQLQHEASKLPFLANAAPVYDDYIHMLVQEGKTGEALDVADHSRARTLAQGLGLATPVQPAILHPGEIAQKAHATLLFYWLGQTQSYLWAVTPKKTELFSLPAQHEITAVVRRYRDALLGPDDVLASSNQDGVALYRMLIEPAGHLISPGSNVLILSDGALSQINFETLIVPSPHPHYWIEDATVASASSLFMLASAKPFSGAVRNALLLGDAVSADPDYPELPKASVEMRRIEKHFAPADETVFARQRASPETYMASKPQQYAYIHFVAHGVASLTDPLDSAIILSRSGTNDDSFKLYARDIIQRPIHARLVTISSCYGGGTRSYAGEGLVGLSWAFLRAGAHNVIGALWEVSDDSTPQLMDELYRELEAGLPPSTALRQAKLDLLHGKREFRSPFFWAPFQLYTGL